MLERRDIFVSYSRANTDFARDLYDKLKELDFTLWRDRSDMEGGENWWEQIKEAIRNVNTMVLVMSPAALASRVVAEEWRYALQEGTRVIPVIAEDVDFNAVPRWMRKRDWYDFRENAPERDLIWDKFIAQLKTPYQPRRVPFTAPALSEHFVNRPEIFDKAKALLLREPDQRQNLALTTAFRGSFGFGKTTLAIALCHDPDIRERFDNGILFITFGETPDVLSLLNQHIKLLSREEATFTDINLATARFRELVDDRDLLIVLDDVWNDLHARPFLEGVRPVRLITTRNVAVANALGARGDLALEVNQMAQAEAVALLLARLDAPQRPADLAPFADFARELGGWALLLELAGAYIADLVINDGVSALEALREAQARLREYGFTAFDVSNETDRNRAVSASMEVSLKRLGDWRERFTELAIFPEDVDIPFEAIQKLWQSTAGLDELRAKDALRAMHRLSLFVRYELSELRRHARLHDAVRKFLRGQLGAERLHRLNDAFLGAYKAESWAELPPDEPYLWDHLAYHLLEAGKRAELRVALLDYRYLQAKLNARNVNALLGDFDAYLQSSDDEPVRLTRQAIEMSAHILAGDRTGLACYLYGRLHSREELPEIKTLREQTAPKILQPLHEPTHYQAGGYLLRTLRKHVSKVNGVLKLRNGCILSWSDDGRLLCWDSQQFEARCVGEHQDEVSGVLELSDSVLVSWSKYENELCLWEGGKVIDRIVHRQEVNGAFRISDREIVSWSVDGELKCYSVGNNSNVRSFRGHEDEVLGALAFEEGQILSWSADSTLRLWSLEGELLDTLRGHERSVLGALVLSDSRILSWAEDKTLRLWVRHRNGFREDKSISFDDVIQGVLELSDSRLLLWLRSGRNYLCQSDDINVEEFLRTQRIKGALKLSRGNVLLWDDEALYTWRIGEDVVKLGKQAIEGALALDDDRVLSWSGDEAILVWTLKGSPKPEPQKHRKGVTLLRQLSSGCLLSAAEDWTLGFWSAHGSRCKIAEGHRRDIKDFLELRDGRLLSWSDDKTLRLWSADGEALATLQGHGSSVNGAIELHNGRLLSWSDDKTLRLWSADGEALATLRGHDSFVNGAIELHNGHLLSWSFDLKLRLWTTQGTLIDGLDESDAKQQQMWLRERNVLQHDIERLMRLQQRSGEHSQSARQMRFNVSWDNGSEKVCLRDARTSELLASFHAESAITTATFLQNGEVIALGCANGQVIFLRVLV
ncbi:MAG: TIR domain-containing protein [Anaerolineae bacterium]|nr:TIR domain-containing protein [Anaerolineae bacterium]